MARNRTDHLPEESRDQRRRTALLYALLILQWHQHIGIKLASSKLQAEARERYIVTLQRFLEMDLHDPEVQHQLARTQVSGIFEYMYGEPCPPDLWSHLAQELEIEMARPRTMGEAGQMLLGILEELRSRPTPERSGVPRDREHLLTAAAEFYQDLPAERNLGGKSLLLSCSLERAASDRVELKRPEELGFHFVKLGAQPDGLIDQVRNGSVLIMEAVGGPQAHERHSRREES